MDDLPPRVCRRNAGSGGWSGSELDRTESAMSSVRGRFLGLRGRGLVCRLLDLLLDVHKWWTDCLKPAVSGEDEGLACPNDDGMSVLSNARHITDITRPSEGDEEWVTA